ncbi:2-amino-4-hydroxy-6-hydroxymethyldihydropteridine diphosphokinase [Paraflavisolibacter sp. H34]|uniref:2-amino-4-hydroxy-6- hydroxymethyldihydropteridine diphosphokinase n=1 Tax=Huijunlia imazamoxiresistens TaxID=3127457 RepID=UPI0030199FC3
MNKVYLLIGGNMGDRRENLRRATEAIHRQCGRVTAASPLYETEAWGLEDQPPFLNQALEIATDLSPVALLQCTLQIEKTLGRQRLEKYGPRPIDIDMLLYENKVVDLPELQVPHPQMPNRRFVLQCLADLAPDYRHPVLEKTILQLLEACTDPLKVNRLEER